MCYTDGVKIILQFIKNTIEKFFDKFKSDKIFRNSIIISTFLILGQILSIYRERMSAQYIGLGTELDIFNAAFRIPDLIYAIFAGFVMTSTMVPYLSKDYVENNLESYNKKFNSSIFGYAFIMIVISIFAVIFMPQLTNIYIDKSFGIDNFDTLVAISRLLMIQPIILGLAISFSSLGQTRDSFYTYTIGPILYTFSSILGIVFFYKSYGLYAVILSVIVGAILHFVLQLVHLKLSDISIRFRYFDINCFKEYLKLAIPRSGSYTASQIVSIVWASFALSIGAGVLAAFTLAKKVFDVPINVILSGIANGSVPTLSKLYVNKDFVTLKTLNNKNLRNVILFSICISVPLYLYTEPILQLVYGDVEDVFMIISILKSISIMVLFSAFNWYITSFFSAIKKPKIVLYANASSAIFILFFTFILDKNMTNFLYMFYFYNLYNSCILLFFFWREYKKML